MPRRKGEWSFSPMHSSQSQLQAPAAVPPGQYPRSPLKGKLGKGENVSFLGNRTTFHYPVPSHCTNYAISAPLNKCWIQHESYLRTLTINAVSRLQAGRPGDWLPAGAEDFLHHQNVQTDPDLSFQPLFVNMTTQVQLVLEIRMSGVSTLLPTYSFMSCTGTALQQK
jgi:hypothetical protein